MVTKSEAVLTRRDMRTGVELTRSQKEKEQREESKGVESPPPDAPKPKELERRPVRSYLVRGYAETTDARVERILRLPNGACWNVLAYWREAA